VGALLGRDAQVEQQHEVGDAVGRSVERRYSKASRGGERDFLPARWRETGDIRDGIPVVVLQHGIALNEDDPVASPSVMPSTTAGSAPKLRSPAQPTEELVPGSLTSPNTSVAQS
jgi:hypothetical protein